VLRRSTLSCMRFGPAATRCGTTCGRALLDWSRPAITIPAPATGGVLARHRPVHTPGEVSVIDAHNGSRGGRAADVRSTLAAATGAADLDRTCTVALEVSVTACRPLEQYSLRALAGESS
jgi:hypothetical protein